MANRPIQLGRLHFSQYQSVNARPNATLPDWENRPKFDEECAVGAFNSLTAVLNSITPRERRRNPDTELILGVFVDAARTAVQGLAALAELVEEMGPHLNDNEEAVLCIVEEYIEKSTWNRTQKPEPPGRLESVLADLVETIDAHAKQAGIDLKLGK